MEGTESEGDEIVTEDHTSNFVQHQPCLDCGSSDACSLFDDGHTYCHACKTHTKGDGTGTKSERKTRISNMIDFEPAFLQRRKLNEETCKRWSYGIGEYNGQKVQVATYRDSSGSSVAQKIRFADKSFVILGEASKMGLYGQSLWRDSGKKIVITEGEIDAMSVSQIQNHRWPVVSLPNGAPAAKKALQKSLDWLEKFEEIILMFDMDEPGRKAAKECVELFTPGKCKIADLPLKDANDMLVADRGDEVVNAIFAAKVQRPDGIVAGTELWDKIITEDKTESIQYPWSSWNQLSLGCRKGEIVCLTAGSGVGKTAVLGEIEHFFLTTQNETLGVIKLEQNVKKSALQLMGIELNKPLRIRSNDVTEAEMRRAYDATVGTGRVFLYDHWGSTEDENLLSKIRYMVRGCGCTTVVLDHISIVVSGMEDGDERRLIDNLMTKLRTMVEELQFRLIIVSHLKRPQGQGHEEGAPTSLSQLRGSAAIAQLSDIVIGLERNQQDEEKKNLTRCRFLKNRFTGETGLAGTLKYDSTTGRLHETTEFDAEPQAASADEDF